jgi:hypothetical protein
VQNSAPASLLSVTDNGVTTLTPTALTGSEATSALDISQTWNTTGTPTLIKANVTNTASNADSRLVDLQAGGSPVFRILPTGVVSAASIVAQFSAVLSLRSNLAAIPGNYLILDNNNVNITTTTSQVQHTRILSTYSPTSGTGVFNQVAINTTINQTGGANGITRGLYVNPTLTAAADWRSVEFSNNTGWGLYGPGTANNYLGGRLGIGSALLTNVNLNVNKVITGASTSYSILNGGTIQSDVSTAYYFRTISDIQNTTFTLANLHFFNATAGGSVTSATLTNQFGFSVNSSLTGATNNYGFYGDIASGTGRWNLYMNGTAANYLAGNTSIGTTTSGGRLTVQGSGTTSSTKALVVNNSTPTAIFEILDNGRISQTIPGVTFNTIFGTGAGASASLSGAHNTIFGTNAGQNNTTASANTLIGSGAGAGVTTGGSNIYIGRDAGSNNQTSSLNTAIGVFAMLNHNTGTHNIVIGFNSARYLADGTTNATSFDSCVYLGNSIKVTSSGVSNEIILGFNAIGNGSNTATLGNTSITNTYLRGNINYTEGGNFVIGTTTGTKIGTATSQKIGFWNATPIVQPTTGVAAATRVGGGGTTVTDSDTFDGYTIAQLVKALRNMGALA